MKADKRYFLDNSGSPRFWLADTAWNAALRGDEEQWKPYLDARARQGFTAIQFVTSQWRGCTNPPCGKLYEKTGGGVSVNNDVLDWMGRFIDMVNERGMSAVPVMLWDNNHAQFEDELDTGPAIDVCRAMRERFSEKEVVWFLGGDGNYTAPDRIRHWKEVGRGTFADAPGACVTMHPCGLSWVGDIFAGEPWFSFVGIQSGHGAGNKGLRFLLDEEYASRWRELEMPFVNIEANYEHAVAYGTDLTLTDYHVRRASYWSLTLAPPAGITYGINNIWIWSQAQNERAENHGDAWTADPWHRALETPGTRSMTILRDFFASLPWTSLLPAPHLLAQTQDEAPLEQRITAAATADRKTVIAYLPCGGDVSLTKEATRSSTEATWFDPRTGERCGADGADGSFAAPDGQDWVLVLEG